MAHKRESVESFFNSLSGATQGVLQALQSKRERELRGQRFEKLKSLYGDSAGTLDTLGADPTSAFQYLEEEKRRKTPRTKVITGKDDVLRQYKEDEFGNIVDGITEVPGGKIGQGQEINGVVEMIQAAVDPSNPKHEVALKMMGEYNGLTGERGQATRAESSERRIADLHAKRTQIGQEIIKIDQNRLRAEAENPQIAEDIRKQARLQKQSLQAELQALQNEIDRLSGKAGQNPIEEDQSSPRYEIIE